MRKGFEWMNHEWTVDVIADSLTVFTLTKLDEIGTSAIALNSIGGVKIQSDNINNFSGALDNAAAKYRKQHRHSQLWIGLNCTRYKESKKLKR